MIEFTIDTAIERPVSEVFAFATDPSRLPEWQTNTVAAERVDEGPLRVGSRLREVHRGPGGREVESLVEVAELEPDRTFALRMIEGPLPVDAHLAFRPGESGRGTKVSFTVEGELIGAKRLLEPLLTIVLKRQFREHCQNLKRVLEPA